MKIFYIYITLCLLLLSCSDKDNELELALHYAGTNRTELEKVLRHYEGDSLKHRAAVFLIENMPYHFGYDLREYRTGVSSPGESLEPGYSVCGLLSVCVALPVPV